MTAVLGVLFAALLTLALVSFVAAGWLYSRARRLPDPHGPLPDPLEDGEEVAS